MVLVTSGVLGAEQLDNSLTPISDAAATFLGPVGLIGVQAAAALAFLTTANAGILTASRYLFAVSKDRLLPPALGRVSGRFNTPYVAILATGVLVMAALLVKLDVLVEAASTVFVLAYILASVCVILLRESGLQNYRPSFRAPLYPWVQIVTVIGFAFLVFEMGERAFLITAALVIVSFVIYWFYGRHRTQRESAVLLLLRRISTRDFPEGSLDEELKAIVRERDEIALDRFDRIIENGLVLDFDRKLSLDELFRQVSEKMAPRVGIEPETLVDLLLAREKDTSTVLSPMLAVPHVVIDQNDQFDILLARCRAGIHFSDRAPDIRTVFVIVGGRAQRNFYLRVLAAIAQIVQNPDFEAKWMAARNEQAMRDIVLLSQRRRHQG
jgi:mannitol/fructose-specific phosphotransferase system IIA component (Ntr-type)